MFGLSEALSGVIVGAVIGLIALALVGWIINK